MTVSIHTTSGWALVIAPHQSMALPTRPRRQRGKVTAFPPSLCHSPPAHLCLSLKLFVCKCCVSSLCPHATCDFQPRFIPLRPSARFIPIGERDKWVSSSCVSLPPSLLVICLHADTPTQMISRRLLTRVVLGLPVSPQVDTICPQSFARTLPKFPLQAILGLFRLFLIYSIFSIETLAPKKYISVCCISKWISSWIMLLHYYVIIIFKSAKLINADAKSYTQKFQSQCRVGFFLNI